jgi:hypothetical protein
VEGFILRAHRTIRDRRILIARALAMLIIPALVAHLGAPAFADISPEFGKAALATNVDPPSIQLAEANLPPVGSLDDYVREGEEHGGGSPSAGLPPQSYQPQAMPPQGYGYSTRGAPPAEWNNSYADPNAERSALIGAAIVGAVAVGMWAWQQHEIRQAQRRARKRFYSHRRAYD